MAETLGSQVAECSAAWDLVDIPSVLVVLVRVALVLGLALDLEPRRVLIHPVVKLRLRHSLLDCLDGEAPMLEAGLVSEDDAVGDHPFGVRVDPAPAAELLFAELSDSTLGRRPQAGA